jgi:hypothetical protein
MSRIVLICSVAALLAAGGTQSVNAAQSAWGKESLACAAVGIDPGNPAFNQCVADLQHSLWAEKNLYDS